MILVATVNVCVYAMCIAKPTDFSWKSTPFMILECFFPHTRVWVYITCVGPWFFPIQSGNFFNFSFRSWGIIDSEWWRATTKFVYTPSLSHTHKWFIHSIDDKMITIIKIDVKIHINVCIDNNLMNIGWCEKLWQGNSTLCFRCYNNWKLNLYQYL